MARGKAKQSKDIKVETYTHKGKKRKNNPHVGLVSSATDKLNGRTKYKHDPHIDPALSWAGKAEGMSIEVQNVSLHIHERIDPKRIVKAFLKKKEQKQFQLDLFEQPDNEPPLNKAIDFYKHEQDWTNRLIAGDSLLVMNSLLNKEGMAGKVQMGIERQHIVQHEPILPLRVASRIPQRTSKIERPARHQPRVMELVPPRGNAGNTKNAAL